MKLIDADKLKAHYSWWKGGTREMTMDEAKGDFDTIVDLQPSIYITYCKDCKYYGDADDHDSRYHECKYFSTFATVFYIFENDYCSCAERKEKK